MTDSDESEGTVAAEQTEPVTQATEQTESEKSPFVMELEKLAGILPEGEQPKPEPVQAEETEVVEAISDETVAEDEPEPEKEEEHPGDKLVPLREVLAEREKKKRANERAEKAELTAEQLKAELAKAAGPQWTPNDRFADIQNVQQLNAMQVSLNKALTLYDAAIDEATDNMEGTAETIVGQNPDGSPKLAVLTKAQIRERRREADELLRIEIPQREKYLVERERETAKAVEVYPELLKEDSEFRQLADGLTMSILSGRAQKQPDILMWVADAVRGRLARLSENGNGTKPVKSNDARKIIESSKQKIAPTPTRSRTFVETRVSSSAKLEQANQKLKTARNAAEKYDAANEALNAMWAAKRGQSRGLQTVGG